MSLRGCPQAYGKIVAAPPVIGDLFSPDSGAAPPNDAHYDDYGSKLQQYTQAHQFLRPVRRAAPQHVDKSEDENNSHCANGDGNDNALKCHVCHLALCQVVAKPS